MDELAHLKSEVSLVDYALHVGYERDATKSTKTVTFLRRTDDKIVVRRGNYGYDIYASVPDHEREQGSIVDFIQAREGLNLGEIRKRLRAWAGRPKLEPEQTSSSIKSRVQTDSEEPDRGKVAAVWAAALWNPEPAYLLARGLPSAVLHDARFRDTFRHDRSGNVLFLHADAAGPCGYERRGVGFKGFGKGGRRGLWTSLNARRCARLVVTESPIDALAYHALHGLDAADQAWPLGYVATGGKISTLQKELLADLISHCADRGCAIVAGFDNDAAGEDMAHLLPELASVPVERHLPIGKDWNCDLQYVVRENGGAS